jgi:hypothetical protein
MVIIGSGGLYSGSCHLEKEDTFGLLRDKTSKSISWDEGVVEGLE